VRLVEDETRETESGTQAYTEGATLCAVLIAVQTPSVAADVGQAVTGMQWATLLTIVVGFLAVLVAIWSHRKATYAQIVTHYSARFQDLMDAAPDALRGIGAVRDLPPRSPELTVWLMKYLDLTFEEWYMHRRGYFPSDLWRIWALDIKEFLRSPLVSREWVELESKYSHHKGFLAFVRKCVATESASASTDAHPEHTGDERRGSRTDQD